MWEVIETLRGTELAGEEAIAATAEWGSLSAAEVRLATRYYGDFREEIDERVQLNRAEAERQRTSWERAQEAIG